MVKGRKREEEYRSYRVVVHVTKKEKELIKGIASDKGMDVSTLIRTVCIYKPVNELIKEKEI